MQNWISTLQNKSTTSTTAALSELSQNDNAFCSVKVIFVRFGNCCHMATLGIDTPLTCFLYWAIQYFYWCLSIARSYLWPYLGFQGKKSAFNSSLRLFYLEKSQYMNIFVYGFALKSTKQLGSASKQRKILHLEYCILQVVLHNLHWLFLVVRLDQCATWSKWTLLTGNAWVRFLPMEGASIRLCFGILLLI